MENQNPNEKQIGGSHYKTKSGYEHWDLIADTGMGYFEGQITKYITRWRKKGGAEDVRKSVHYYEKLLRLYEENRVGPYHQSRPNWGAFLQRFLEDNKLSTEEKSIFIAIISYRDYEQLVAVGTQLYGLLRIAQLNQGTPEDPEKPKPSLDSIDAQRCPHGKVNKGNCAQCRSEVLAANK